MHGQPHIRCDTLLYVILALISYSRGNADWDSIPMPIMTHDLIFKSQHTKGYTGFRTKTEVKRSHRTITQCTVFLFVNLCTFPVFSCSTFYHYRTRSCWILKLRLFCLHRNILQKICNKNVAVICMSFSLTVETEKQS